MQYDTCRNHLSSWRADVANVEIGIHLTTSKARGHKKEWKNVEDDGRLLRKIVASQTCQFQAVAVFYLVIVVNSRMVQ